MRVGSRSDRTYIKGLMACCKLRTNDCNDKPEFAPSIKYLTPIDQLPFAKGVYDPTTCVTPDTVSEKRMDYKHEFTALLGIGAKTITHGSVEVLYLEALIEEPPDAATMIGEVTGGGQTMNYEQFAGFMRGEHSAGISPEVIGHWHNIVAIGRWSLIEGDIKELRTIFDMLDIDKDGYASPHEMNNEWAQDVAGGIPPQYLEHRGLGFYQFAVAAVERGSERGLEKLGEVRAESLDEEKAISGLSDLDKISFVKMDIRRAFNNTDEFLRTTLTRIWMLLDLNGNDRFTVNNFKLVFPVIFRHIADDQGKVALRLRGYEEVLPHSRRIAQYVRECETVVTDYCTTDGGMCEKFCRTVQHPTKCKKQCSADQRCKIWIPGQPGFDEKDNEKALEKQVFTQVIACVAQKRLKNDYDQADWKFIVTPTMRKLFASDMAYTFCRSREELNLQKDNEWIPSADFETAATRSKSCASGGKGQENTLARNWKRMATKTIKEDEKPEEDHTLIQMTELLRDASALTKCFEGVFRGVGTTGLTSVNELMAKAHSEWVGYRDETKKSVLACGLDVPDQESWLYLKMVQVVIKFIYGEESEKSVLALTAGGSVQDALVSEKLMPRLFNGVSWSLESEKTGDRCCCDMPQRKYTRSYSGECWIFTTETLKRNGHCNSKMVGDENVQLHHFTSTVAKTCITRQTVSYDL